MAVTRQIFRCWNVCAKVMIITYGGTQAQTILFWADVYLFIQFSPRELSCTLAFLIQGEGFKMLNCVLYSSSYRPLSPLSPPHSPLAIVTLFLISMSLVIFCLLFSFVDYVPVEGEIIWYLSLTTWLISLSIMLSSSVHAIPARKFCSQILRQLPTALWLLLHCS